MYLIPFPYDYQIHSRIHVETCLQAEGNAGKKTIIVDFKSEEGRKVAVDLIKRSDIVLLNKSDEQVEAMGLGREALDQINQKAIHLNVQASTISCQE